MERDIKPHVNNEGTPRKFLKPCINIGTNYEVPREDKYIYISTVIVSCFYKAMEYKSYA